MRLLARLVFIGCFGLAVWIGCPLGASAASVSLRVSVGFSTFYVPGQWVPLTVNVSNMTSQTFHGDLVFSIPKIARYPLQGNLVWPITVSRGGSVQQTIGVPGRLIEAGGMLSLRDDSGVVTQAKVSGVHVDGSDIAGIVTDRPSAVQIPPGVTSPTGSAELVPAYVPPSHLPSSAQLLQSLTYLYIDGSAARELTDAQVRAVFAWVREGGILILGGVEPNAGQLSLFPTVSPVQGQIVLDQDASSVANYANSTAPQGTLPQQVGPASTDSQVLIGTPTQALFADRVYGRGVVAYIGLDASSPTLVSWAGNATFWDAMLQTLREDVVPSRVDLFGPSGMWTLMNAADQFPQLHSPPLWIWELVFGAYVLLCGPVLYVILRRRRKNEWAWLFLPALSTVLALSIYELGVAQRPNGVLTQGLGIIDIIDQHLAKVTGVEALMSPQTRSYAVTTRGHAWTVPLSDAITANRVLGGQATVFTSQGTVTSFHSVLPWGGRFAYTSIGLENVGAFTGALYESKSSLGGYLINDTSLDFSDVALIFRGHVISVGKLNAGASVDVQSLGNETATKANLSSQLGAALPSASHGVGRAMFDYANALALAQTPESDAMIIAWTHEEPALFKTDGPSVPATPQWIARQLFPVISVVE